MRIAIIGSSGKKGEIRKVNPFIYKKMVSLTAYNIKKISEGKEVTLVSGGAALSDHLAVDLYLNGHCNNLKLYLPCQWNESQCKYNEVTHTGRFSNELHKNFSYQTKKNSLEELQLAMEKGAITIIGKGFYERNAQVAADADAVIAWTFDKKMTPGTKHTWDLCNVDTKVHLLIK